MGSILPLRTTYSAVSRVLRQVLQTRPLINGAAKVRFGACSSRGQVRNLPCVKTGSEPTLS